MSRKYKATGCAKFFFVLIILAPLAYMGASYYNGQDGWQNLKNLIGIGKASSAATDERTENLEEVADLRKEVRRLEAENRQLLNDLKECQEQSE